MAYLAHGTMFCVIVWERHYGESLFGCVSLWLYSELLEGVVFLRVFKEIGPIGSIYLYLWCKEPTCQCRRHKRCAFDPWVRKIPRRRAWQPTPVFLPGECCGQRSLWATVHGVTKSQTRLSDLAHIYLSIHPSRKRERDRDWERDLF